jgi:hypothetical protein
MASFVSCKFFNLPLETRANVRGAHYSHLCYGHFSSIITHISVDVSVGLNEGLRLRTVNLPDRLPVEFDHVHDLDGVVRILLAQEFNKSISLKRKDEYTRLRLKRNQVL